MAKMRMRRRSLIKAPLESLYRRAQPLELGSELLELRAPYHCAALGAGIVGDGFADAAHCIALPARKRAQRAADALRRHVAEDARQLLFRIPAQMLREIAQLVGELARPRNAVESGD